jgi:acetyl/propionyl-CoA carboxylase alpha subunit
MGPRMNYVEVEFQGKTIRVPARKAAGKLWFHHKGETHVVELGGGRSRGQQKSKTHPGVIHAPMPGKITRVAVKKGETVSAGQTLLVMEAMKMEYTLEADIAGVISELNAETGAQVNLGATLVKITAG